MLLRASSCAQSWIRRALACGAALAIALMMTVCIAGFAAPFAHADDANDSEASATDFPTWSAVAESINQQLADGQSQYKANQNSQAANLFLNARYVGYEASNFGAVVRDTIGSDKAAAQQQQFQQLEQLAYQSGKSTDIDTAVATLSADLTASAQTLDANAQLAKPADYAKAREQQTKQERETIQKNKKRVNKGKGDRTWGEVANEMTPMLDKAYKKFAAGDGQSGQSMVNTVYYQYYEKLGFEKNVLNAISGNRVSQVEYQFKMIRKNMREGGDKTEVKGMVDQLKAWLVEDAAKLDGGAASTANPFTKFITSAAGQAFLILIREGLEALLVVAAVIAYLVKSGNKRFTKWIYLGILVGLAGSGIIAVIFGLLFGGSGPQQEIMEGVCALVACLMLLWTSNWMLNKRSVESWNNYIRQKTEAAVAKAGSAAQAGDKVTIGMVVSLAMLSFLAVFREGAETVIFYESIYSMSQDAQGMWIGGIAAAIVLVMIFLAIRFTSVRIPIGPFFLVTSILMAVLVVVFAGGGVHALIEGDAVQGTYLSAVPTNDWIGLYPYAETITAQIIAAIAVIALFVVGFARQRKVRSAQVVQTASADQIAQPGQSVLPEGSGQSAAGR